MARIRFNAAIVAAASLSVCLGALLPLLSPLGSARLLALPVAAAFFMLALARTHIALIATLVLAPLAPTVIGIQLPGNLPVITIQRALMLALWCALAVRVLLREERQQADAIPVPWLAIGFYLGANVAAAFVSLDPTRSISRVVASALDGAGLLALIVVVGRQRGRAFVSTMLLALWASCLALSILGLIDTVTGFNPLYSLQTNQSPVFTPIYRLGIRRGQGLLPNSTALSIVSAVGLSLGISVLQNASGLRRLLVSIGLIVHLAAMIGSMGRTGWIVGLIGAGLWFALNRSIRASLLLLGALGAISLSAFGLATTLRTALLEAFDISRQNDVSTALNRLLWPAVAWDLVNNQASTLLLGYGPGLAVDLAEAWRSGDILRATLTDSYLIALVESGLLGLFGFVFLLATSIWRGWRAWHRVAAADYGVAVALFIAATQIAVGCVALPLFVWTQTYLLFWALFGLILLLQGGASSASPVRRRRNIGLC